MFKIYFCVKFISHSCYNKRHVRYAFCTARLRECVCPYTARDGRAHIQAAATFVWSYIICLIILCYKSQNLTNHTAHFVVFPYYFTDYKLIIYCFYVYPFWNARRNLIRQGPHSLYVCVLFVLSPEMKIHFSTIYFLHTPKEINLQLTI